MKKFAGILVLLLFIPVSVDSQQPILVVELSSNGEATVTQLLSAKSIVSSISVPLISDRISKVLVTDERGILLKTTQSGNSLDIATLGASGVTLTYKADITSFDSQAWNVSYESETETVVVLPQLATIVSVSSIPIDIEDNAVIMPPGPVSITYTISEVSTKTFFVLEAGQNYPVDITSASKIDDFFKQSNESRFGISSSATLLVVVPSIVLPNPIDASLNGGEVSFNPYYNNGTHNWIRVDPHEAGVIEIGGDVRASQVTSDPMTDAGSGENDSIFLTVGIILGVLALGFVVLRKYFKIGLVRTSSSKGSNQLDISSKHDRKDMKGRHFGIFALAFFTLLLTVPSAFADNDLSILDALDDLDNLQTISDNNNFDIDFEPVRSLYLAALEDPSLFADAEAAHDGLYGEIYDNIEGQQAVRHDEYVINAQASLSFLIENGEHLGLSSAVIDQLATTLEIIEYGTDAEIDAGTGQIGITLSVLPALDLPKSFTTGSGAAEQLKAKLPPGIAKQYGYSTDSDPSIVSYEGPGNGAGEYNGDALPPGYDTKLTAGDESSIDNLPEGFLNKYDGIRDYQDALDVFYFENPDGTLADFNSEFDFSSLEDLPDGFVKKLEAGDALPKGFLKKFNGIAEIFGFTSYGDNWEDDWGYLVEEDSKGERDCSKGKCRQGHGPDKDKSNNGGGNNGGGNNGGGNNGGGNNGGGNNGGGNNGGGNGNGNGNGNGGGN